MSSSKTERGSEKVPESEFGRSVSVPVRSDLDLIDCVGVVLESYAYGANKEKNLNTVQIRTNRIA